MCCCDIGCFQIQLQYETQNQGYINVSSQIIIVNCVAFVNNIDRIWYFSKYLQ
jgi:hypothetical protein